ncbi:HAMP domain-containing protein [Undibacterium sp. FT31W]|uniref:histidine kinase n=2 Tax=Undibacterium griseum TaxID=2762295 RepID=A0ABR6YI04_9BURK|nr:HAMP domain-containing protein [Undibacterium griseum]
MWARVLAALLVGVLLSAALTVFLAFGEREKTLMQYRESHSIERVEQLVRALDALPTANRESFLETAPRLGLKVTTLPEHATDTPPHSDYAKAVSEKLGRTFKVHSLPADPSLCPPSPPQQHNPNIVRLPCEALSITLHDGTILRLTVMPPRTPAPPLRDDFVQYFLLFLVFIAILALIIARMTMRPLQKMAEAATALGQDINRPPLPETGASEIVQATRAFNAMQARIRNHISQRTHMLAAITHDLQTPLTRLRLRLEKVNDSELREKLINDLSGMQLMIREGLDLARSIESSEGLRPVDIDSLLDSVCSDAGEAGQNVTFEGKPGITVLAKPQALRRCLTNLIDNAVKYGHYARVSLTKGKAAGNDVLDIFIRDGGNGIPQELQSKVFEPFFRIETSRSRESGGTGLGLTIAQNIVQQHGGRLQLHNLPEGGLEVQLTLPLPA